MNLTSKKTILYRTNPMIRGRWMGEDSVVLQNVQTKKKYALSYPVFELMVYCSKPRSEKAIRDKVKQYFHLNDAEAASIVEDLFTIKLFIEKNTDAHTLWFSRNWRNALYFHLLTSDTEFADMGQFDEANIKTTLLKRYLKVKPVPSFYKEYKNSISLPKPEMGFASVGNVLLNRRTTRVFDPSAITLEQLSTILYVASQPAKAVRDYAKSRKQYNPLILVLSSYTPCEIYFSAHNVSGILNGLYHYNMNTHAIHLIKKGDFSKKMKTVAIGQGVENASVVIVISSVFERYMWRYRNSRAYRNLLIESSSLAQRIILVTEAMGLKQFLTPAMRDSMADELLGLDGYTEASTYLVAVGNGIIKK